MHKERALRFLQKEMDYTAEDALAKWNLIDSLTPDDVRDEDGPPQSKLQLPIPVDKYFDGSTASAHEKECNLETKTKKNSSQAEIDKARADVGTGLANFSDGMYGATGGSFLQNLGKLGVSFGDTRSTRSNDAVGFGSNLVVDNAITKKKHYELGPARVNLEDYIQTGIVDLSDKLKELWSKCTAADELADAATGGEGLEGLESWRNLLAQKMTWLRAVGCAVTHDANTYDCAQEPVVPGTMSDPDYNFISKLNASVLAAITAVAIGAEANTEGAADGDQLEKAQAACVAISAAATAGPMDLSSSVALPVLARFGWTGLASPGGSGFTSPSSFLPIGRRAGKDAGMFFFPFGSMTSSSRKRSPSNPCLLKTRGH